MMRRIVCIIFFVWGFNAYGQTLEDKHHRVLILLDASLSMNEPTDGYATKYAAASDFIIRLMDSIYSRNDEVEFGLRVYGHQYPINARQCFDTKLEVQFSRDNIEQMKMRLTDVKPSGISNTYTVLKEALEYDITSTNNYIYHVLIITDGGEACSGDDICNLYGLLKYKQVATPCIALLNNKKTFNCYTGSTNHLTKENTNISLGCLGIPEHYTKPATPKMAALTETKSIQKTDKIVLPKQQTENKQTNILHSPKNLKQAPLAAIETHKRTGYLKIEDFTSNQRIELHKEGDGEYRPYKLIEISNKNINQPIALPEGMYRLVYKNLSRQFVIVPGMITMISRLN